MLRIIRARAHTHARTHAHARASESVLLPTTFSDSNYNPFLQLFFNPFFRREARFQFFAYFLAISDTFISKMRIYLS